MAKNRDFLTGRHRPTVQWPAKIKIMGRIFVDALWIKTKKAKIGGGSSKKLCFFVAFVWNCSKYKFIPTLSTRKMPNIAITGAVAM